MRTEPLSPIEVEVKMAQCIEALEDAVTTQRTLGYESATASHTYRQAQARHWLLARQEADLKTDKLKEAWVVSRTSDEMFMRDCAEVAYDTQKSVVRALQTEAELLRSLARSSRDLVDSWHGRH